MKDMAIRKLFPFISLDDQYAPDVSALKPTCTFFRARPKRIVVHCPGRGSMNELHPSRSTFFQCTPGGNSACLTGFLKSQDAAAQPKASSAVQRKTSV